MKFGLELFLISRPLTFVDVEVVNSLEQLLNRLSLDTLVKDD